MAPDEDVPHPLAASPVTPEFAELYALLDEIRHTPPADRILNAVGAVEMRYIAAVKAERERCAKAADEYAPGSNTAAQIAAAIRSAE